MYSDKDNKIEYLVQECGVTKSVARVALGHCRGSVSFAKDMLSSDTCKQIYGREAREYDMTD